MKSLSLIYHNRRWSSKTFISGMLCTIAALICGTVMLHSQPPPPGQSGGNPPPCDCDCEVTLDGMKADMKDCGPECAEEVQLPDRDGWRDYFESVPKEECLSGQKMMRQKTVIKEKARYTKQKGKITFQKVRRPPKSNPNADCSGCPPCDPLVVDRQCGESKKKCDPQDGDRSETDTEDPPEDRGCSSYPT